MVSHLIRWIFSGKKKSKFHYLCYCYSNKENKSVGLSYALTTVFWKKTKGRWWRDSRRVRSESAERERERERERRGVRPWGTVNLTLYKYESIIHRGLNSIVLTKPTSNLQPINFSSYILVITKFLFRTKFFFPPKHDLPITKFFLEYDFPQE